MQKLLCALLASTVSAGELLSAQKPSLNKDMIQASLDIDIDPQSILPCQYITQTSVFNFQNVLDPTKPIVTKDTSEYYQTLEVDFTDAGEKVVFNFCEQSFTPKEQNIFSGNGCDDNKASNSFISDGTTCSGLNAENDADVGDTAGFEIMDSDGLVQGISLIFTGGVCEGGKYNLNVTSMCGDDGKNSIAPPAIQSAPTKTGACNYTVVYDTKAGCPVFSLSQVSRFFYKYSYLFGAVLIGAGFFLAFFGNKFVNIVIFLVSSFALIIIGSVLFINLALEKVDKEWVVWTAFVVIALVSFGFGLLLIKYRKYGIGLFAGWGGVMLGFVVTTTFAVGNIYAYYAILVVGAIGMFFIAIKVEQTAIILLTAFIGAYSFVRGISLYAGGFPSESELHAELEAGVITWETMPKTYYGYLAGILVIFIASSVYQFKHNKTSAKKRAELKTFMK